MVFHLKELDNSIFNYYDPAKTQLTQKFSIQQNFNSNKKMISQQSLRKKKQISREEYKQNSYNQIPEKLLYQSVSDLSQSHHKNFMSYFRNLPVNQNQIAGQKLQSKSTTKVDISNISRNENTSKMAYRKLDNNQELDITDSSIQTNFLNNITQMTQRKRQKENLSKTEHDFMKQNKNNSLPKPLPSIEQTIDQRPLNFLKTYNLRHYLKRAGELQQHKQNQGFETVYDAIQQREKLRHSVKRKGTRIELKKDQLLQLQATFAQIQAREDRLTQDKQKNIKELQQKKTQIIDEYEIVMKKLRNSKIVLLGYENYPLDETIQYILEGLIKLLHRLRQNSIVHDGGRFHNSFKAILKNNRKPVLKYLFFRKDNPTKIVLFDNLTNDQFMQKSLVQFLYTQLYGNTAYKQCKTEKDRENLETNKIKLFLFQIRNFMQDVQDYLVKCQGQQIDIVNESITMSQVHINKARQHFKQNKPHLIKSNDLHFDSLGSTVTAQMRMNNEEHYKKLDRIEKECGIFQHLDKTQVMIEQSYDQATLELIHHGSQQQNQHEFTVIQ